MTAQLALPFGSGQERHTAPLELLAGRSRHLATVVEATSRRGPVRSRRAQLLLLLLRLRCPTDSRPKHSWYVPGAVARLGAEGIRRAWKGFFGEEPPSLRTVRSYLGLLEQACAIVREPGEPMPWHPDPKHPERRPRYPDTFHVVESERASRWWADVGHQRLDELGERRHLSSCWRAMLGDWRSEVSKTQLELYRLERVDELDEISPAERSTELVASLRCARGPFDLLAAARAAGAHLGHVASIELAADTSRLAASLAMLAITLQREERGRATTRVRSRGRWLLWAFRHATPTEHAAALEALRSNPGGNHDDPSTEDHPRLAQDSDAPHGAPC